MKITVGDLVEALSQQPGGASTHINEHHPIRAHIRVPGRGGRPMPVRDLIANLQMLDSNLELDMNYPKEI